MDTALSLASFQQSFARALQAPQGDAEAPLAALQAQPGFAVYRNTVRRGCIDALQANYPAVARVVGDDWFRAAALVYVQSHWPRQPMLADYGDAFADFLAGFAPASELPYLPEVARLDRCWTEAHLAADAPLLDPAAFTAQVLAAGGPVGGTAGGLRLRLHPATRWYRSPQTPVHTLWTRNRAPAYDDSAFDWTGEGALFTRPDGAVRSDALSAAGAALLDACAAGAELGAAIEAAATQATAGDDLGRLLPKLIGAGAFALPVAPEDRRGDRGDDARRANDDPRATDGGSRVDDGERHRARRRGSD